MMRLSPLQPTEGDIPEDGSRLRPFPLDGLEADTAAWIRKLDPATEGGVPTLAAVRSGAVAYLVTTGEDVPDPLPGGLDLIPLGFGDRREVLLHGTGGLGQLEAGARVVVSSPRQRALLSALHPGLRAVDGASDETPRIVPLWPDPALEVQGDVLEWESWLPAPGQGMPVLVHAGAADGAPRHPEAGTVLHAERDLARRFPDAIVCARGQVFGDGIRIRALLLSADGRQAVRGAHQGGLDDPGAVVEALVRLLLDRGADRISHGGG